MQAFVRERDLWAEAPYRRNPLPHHVAGLTWTASGYGARIPTVHQVQVLGRWRRVYAAQWANAGTMYIGKLADGRTVELI